MVYPLILGGLAVLGGGLFTTSLVASLATPVALILAAASGIGFFAKSVQNGFLEDVANTDAGWTTVLAGIGLAVFYLVYILTEAAITALSPIAGLTVIGLAVSVFIFGPSFLFDLANALKKVYH